MRRFPASIWFPLLTCIVLAGGTAAAFALLKPTGADVNNDQIVRAFRAAGWVAGPVIGLLSFIMMCILNLLRRTVRLRKTGSLHPIVILVGILPWFVFGWIITDEPRYTPFARAAIDFVARPMLWGTLIAALFTIMLSIPLLIPAKKKK